MSSPSAISVPHRSSRRFLRLLALLCLGVSAGCGNNPYPRSEWRRPALYSYFVDEPKSLDPTYSYYVHEARIVDVINLSFYQYRYLKRNPVQAGVSARPNHRSSTPYPFTEVVDGKRVSRTGEIWTFRLKHGVRFQDDPCFPGGKGREVVAADIIYAFKRMADPKINCPIVSYVEDKILGFEDYYSRNRERAKNREPMDFSPQVEGLDSIHRTRTCSGSL